ncbi:MAG: hypothetical protein JW974_03495 [Alphaproteobacteria bacterium]|nr:hypothetical protein [Alphaproteobacteria bacterium]MBN2675303.1 hypothetical protein [Alphaproteobacteria bacterium]
MATILERNKKVKTPKKSQEDYAEDALYREVWEDVNNEKTMVFLRKYSRTLIAGAIILLILITGIQLIRHNNHISRIATAESYEKAIETVDARALVSLSKNSSGATADLAIFQSFILSGDISKLEILAKDGHTRDFRDLAKLHLAGQKGDSMSAKDFEKYLSSLNTKHSPFYYNSLLMISQKYLAEGNKKTGNVWLNKIINDKDAPAIISASAQTLL